MPVLCQAVAHNAAGRRARFWSGYEAIQTLLWVVGSCLLAPQVKLGLGLGLLERTRALLLPLAFQGDPLDYHVLQGAMT